MIPNYKTTCNKVKIDLGNSTYQTVIEQIAGKDDTKIKCPFCKINLELSAPDDEDQYADAYIACYVCKYTLGFDNHLTTFLPLRIISYKGAHLHIKTNKDEIALKYVPNPIYDKIVNKPHHTWKPTTLLFTVKELLNHLNTLHLLWSSRVKPNR